MKSLIPTLVFTSSLLALSACEDGRDHHDHDRGGQTTTTTTEQTTIRQPVEATTDTRTIRTY